MTVLTTFFALLSQIFLVSTPTFVATDDPRDPENRRQYQEQYSGGQKGHCPHG